MPRIITVQCDICSRPIDASQPWHKLIAPLSASDGERLLHAQGTPTGPLGLLMAGGLPNAVRLDVCNRCIDERLPEVAFQKIVAVEATVDERRARAHASQGE